MKFNYLTGKYGEKIFNLGALNHYGFFIDENMAVTSGAGIIVFWNIATGEINDILDTQYDDNVNLAFPEDRKIMAAIPESLPFFSLWNPDTKKEIRRFRGHTGPVQELLFLDDDRKILTCSSDGTVRLWDAETANELRRFEGNDGEINNIAVCPEERLIAASPEDGTVMVWDMETGDLVHTFKGFNDRVSSISFSYKKRILAASSYDGTVRIRHLVTGKEIGCIHPNLGRIDSCRFVSDSSIIEICSCSDLVKYWDAETLAPAENAPASTLKADMIFRTDDDNFYVIPRDREISFIIGNEIIELPPYLKDREYDVELHPGPRFYRNNIHIILDRNFSDILEIADNYNDFAKFNGGKNMILIDAHMVTKPLYGDISLMSEKTGREIFHTDGYTGGIGCAAFSHDGRLLSIGSFTGKLFIREVETGKLLTTINDHYDFQGTNALFSPDDRFIFHGDYNGNICSREVLTGKKVREFPIHISFDLHGEILAGVVKDSEKVRLWNGLSGEIISEINLEGIKPGEVRLRSDGKMLAARCYNNSGDVILVNFITGKKIALPAEITEQLSDLDAFSFSPDGKTIAIGSLERDRLVLWDVEGESVKERYNDTDKIDCLAFSPDGRLLVCGDDNYNILIRDMETGRITRTLTGHTTILHTLAFSPDGKTLASSSWDGTVRVWGLAADESG